MNKTLLLISSLALSFNLSAANSKWWKEIKSSDAEKSNKIINAKNYYAFQVNLNELNNELSNVPHESLKTAQESESIISIPMPDGTILDFRIVETDVVHPDLKLKYPQLKTYQGVAVNNPAVWVAIDNTQNGFRAMITSPNGTTFIDPFSLNNPNQLMSYHKSDFETSKMMNCLLSESRTTEIDHENFATAVGETIRTYRIAVSATGEYTTFHGGTKAGALAAITTTINRVNQVYIRDLSLKYQLIPNNDTLIFLNASTDPFTNSDAGSMIQENPTVINQRVGSANYDIGHVVATDGAGLAGLGVTCGSGKARGVTGISSPVGDPFDIDYVAHEIGHQMDGNHTFNNCNGNGNTQAPAFEPGSGVTIMAYAGLCGGSFNIANNSIDQFHAGNLDEIILFTTTGNGKNCGSTLATLNTPPVASYIESLGKTIPKSTPFEITGAGTDIDGDTLTYCWEQVDNGPRATTMSAPTGNAPLFRSFKPSENTLRSFPLLSGILTGNNTTLGEYLSSYTRNIKLRLTVRDNNAIGGGIGFANYTLAVDGNSGPFKVQTGNQINTVFTSGLPVDITWDVAGSNNAPVNCQNVDIYLSVNNGASFDYLLAQNTSNDGAETIVLPSFSSIQNQCRFKIKASNNLFFDINDRAFRINVLNVGIENTLGNNENINVYPNPAQNEVSVSLNLIERENVSIKIIDLTGKTINNYNLGKVNQMKVETFNISDLPKGFYLISVEGTNFRNIQKLIIE